MGIRDFFSRKPQTSDIGQTKVLVCSLDPKFDELLKADGEIYLRIYPSTVVCSCAGPDELIRAMNGKHIVHILADVSPAGVLGDRGGREFTGTDLIRAAGDADVKLLWLASDNKPEGYIKGFKPVKPLNLVMTISRNGPNFSTFLSQLLSRLSGGEKMPAAWVALSPQNAGDPRQRNLPETIFSAGQGKATFR